MTKRLYGLDLLKGVSMQMIVVLHVLGVGGILVSQGFAGWSYRTGWLMETVCMCSVNCFGLVSGYVQCKGRHRYSRIVSLWIRVVLECLAITAVFAAVSPQVVTWSDWLKAVTPIYHNVYWYFTSYFALFLFVPFINKMMAALTKRELLMLAGTIIVLFTILNNVTREEIFAISSGYSFLWLCCLYVLGAVIRLLDIRDSFGWGWLAAGFCAVIGAAWVAYLLLGRQAIIAYTSPFILAAAAFLLLLFRRIRVSSPRAVKLISLIARTSFGVYIIHTNPLVWENVLSNRFVAYAAQSPAIMALMVLATAVVIYIACTAGDWLVEKLMKLIRTDLLESKTDLLFDRLLRPKAKTEAGK